MTFFTTSSFFGGMVASYLRGRRGPADQRGVDTCQDLQGRDGGAKN
jgi:hypothetical protein